MLFAAQALRDGARLRHVLLASHMTEITEACSIVSSALEAGKKVLFCGNGGSAADAQHMAAELVGRFVAERRGLPGIALTVDTSILTAVGNDYGFDRIFSRQVEALGAEGDVLIAISTSGGSPNVKLAIEAARQLKMKVVGFSGGSPKSIPFAEMCDVCIRVPSLVTARIQEAHTVVLHIVCEAVDAAIMKTKVTTARPGKELSREDLADLRQWSTTNKLTIAWTNGAFDVMHAGHLRQLEVARSTAAQLVVGINTDEAIRAAKGETRPIFPLAERIAMLSALEMVDYVHVFPEATPEAALEVLRPDIHCKGADYEPPNGKPIPERKLVESYGGKIVYVPMLEGRSTTSTLARLANAK